MLAYYRQSLTGVEKVETGNLALVVVDSTSKGADQRNIFFDRNPLSKLVGYHPWKVIFDAEIKPVKRNKVWQRQDSCLVGASS